MPILCATLSSIIANKEIQHIDNAIDVLWKLYAVYPEIVPFRSFGNLLIDIIIFVSFSYVMLSIHGQKRTTCSGLMRTALNNVLLPTLFEVLNNTEQVLEPELACNQV